MLERTTYALERATSADKIHSLCNPGAHYDQSPPRSMADQSLDQDHKGFSLDGHGGGTCRQMCSLLTACSAPTRTRQLGILDWQRFRQALQLRWLWRARTQPGTNLGISGSNTALEEFFNRSLRITIGDDKTCLFWINNWLNGRSVRTITPHLWEAVPATHRRMRTVAKAMHNIS